MELADQLIDAIACRDAVRLKALMAAVGDSAETLVDSSLLQLSTRVACKDCVQVLLDCGLDANAADHEGHTALYWAVTMNVIDIVEILLRAGADPKLAHDTGQDAISQAQRWNRTEILNMLMQQR